MKKIVRYLLITCLFIVILLFIYIYISVQIDEPKPGNTSIINEQVTTPSANFSFIKNNWFKRSINGNWELYIEGSPYERGFYSGKLTKEHISKQEHYFIEYLATIIPSKSYLNVLKVFVAWFNRDMDTLIKDEYKMEIYGVSRFAPDGYDYIGPKYQRMLNYHAAHDIGHALQNMKLVGCSSFATWGDKSYDQSLIVARTFDFYAGDDFAKEKIIAFVNPEKGYKYMSITWGGMTGVVSGMNEHGLTVTINAAENEIPGSSGVPISLITREILQYADSIDAAFTIAKSRSSFVSESIMIGSAKDNKTVIIEKSPAKTVLVEPIANYIISTNHFKKNNSINSDLKPEESSFYRYRRIVQLLNRYKTITIPAAVAILRDRYGLDDKNIGLTNEKTINQLLAHHAVIFEPQKRKAWVSTYPYQLGKIICYDLKKVFNRCKNLKHDTILFDRKMTIPEDPFMKTGQYEKYIQYKQTVQLIKKSIIKNKTYLIDKQTIDNLIDYNPQLYSTYATIGDYYMSSKQYSRAIVYYNIALKKEIARKAERQKIQDYVNKCMNEITKK